MFEDETLWNFLELKKSNSLLNLSITNKSDSSNASWYLKKYGEGGCPDGRICLDMAPQIRSF